MLAMRRCKGRRVTRDENTNDNNNVCDSVNSVSNSEAYENTNDNNNVCDSVKCVTNSDEAKDLSFPKLEVWTGIMQFDDMSSIIPTVGAVNIPICESPLSDERRDSESPSPGEIPDNESSCSVPSCLEGLFDDESVNKLCEGIMLESPSIPTAESPVTLPQEICDCGSPGGSIEIVSGYYSSGDEDELSVLYESYGSHIKVKPYDTKKRRALSEEISIFDNISQKTMLVTPVGNRAVGSIQNLCVS